MVERGLSVLECGGLTPLWTGRLDGPPETNAHVKPPHSKELSQCAAASHAVIGAW